MAQTACPACRSPVSSRQWTGERTFTETYQCGASRQWGEGPKVLQPCTAEFGREVVAVLKVVERIAEASSSRDAERELPDLIEAYEALTASRKGGT